VDTQTVSPLLSVSRNSPSESLPQAVAGSPRATYGHLDNSRPLSIRAWNDQKMLNVSELYEL